jgi:RNA polymerase sigma-70 factor (ECF subfamily)
LADDRSSASPTERNALVTDPDQEDISDCLNGDREAYGRLVVRYTAQISAQLWRLCRDRAVCEELVQEVFVEAYFSLDTYQGKAPLIQWLRRIAARVGYRYCRRTAGRPPHLPIEEWDGAETRADEPDPAVAATLVHALLARLAPKDRLIMTLIYLEDCSIGEVAERTGWSTGAIKMRTSRAREELRRIVEREKLLEDGSWNL